MSSLEDMRDLLEVHRRWLAGLVGGLTRRQMKIVREAVRELTKELEALPWESWGAVQRRATLVMVSRAVSSMTEAQSKQLLDEIPKVVKGGQRHTARLLRSMDKKFTGSVTPIRFDTLEWWEDKSKEVGEVRLRQFHRSFTRYGASSVKAIEDRLARTVMLGRPWWEARDEVASVVRNEIRDRDWMVDRILRTESSAAYNGTALAALQDEDSGDDPMYKRLVATFDSVTGKDSVLLSGQIKPVNKPFYDHYFGKEYMAPPNRPNDREIVVGWRESYGSLDVETPSKEELKDARKESARIAKRASRPQAEREVAELERQELELSGQVKIFTDKRTRESVRSQLTSVRRRRRALVAS